MTIDDWRNIRTFIVDANNLMLFASLLFCLTKFRLTRLPFSLIIFYLLVSVFFEVLAFYSVQTRQDSNFDNLSGHFYVLIEACLMGSFLYLSSQYLFTRKIVLSFIGILVVYQICILFFKSSIESFSSSALLCGLFIFPALMVIKDLSNTTYKRKFYRQPQVMFILGIIVSYMLVLTVYFFLPDLITYSKILAIQFLIFKSTIGIAFYVLSGYVVWKSTN